MADNHRRPPLPLAALLAILLAGCGQTGDLYLPQATGEIVTRPTQTPPSEAGESSNSPQSVDSPAVPPTPAPEVTEPEDEKQKQQPPAPSTPPPTQP
jgi:predicted small lipoprotein YifL